MDHVTAVIDLRLFFSHRERGRRHWFVMGCFGGYAIEMHAEPFPTKRAARRFARSVQDALHREVSLEDRQAMLLRLRDLATSRM